MSWKEYYKDRCICPDEAALKVKSGDRVVLGHAAAEPTVLTDALVRNHQKFQNVEIVHMLSLGKSEYCNPGMEKHFCHNSLFVGSKVRNCVNDTSADFTPCYFSQVPSLFTDGLLPVDVTFVQMSVPDSHGYCSLGVSVDYGKSALESSKLVSAQVNEKMVLTFMMGTKKLYDFVDNNPLIHMAPVNYVNDPAIIAQNFKMVSINSCVQIDLLGQVCSERIGLKQISVVGGQVDFVRGANMCPGGKSIIAMPSTTADGRISKIAPFLDEGATVTTSRYDVNCIVTEYGLQVLGARASANEHEH